MHTNFQDDFLQKDLESGKLCDEGFYRISEFKETVDISRLSKMFIYIAESQALFRRENRTLERFESAQKYCQNDLKIDVAQLAKNLCILIDFQKGLPQSYFKSNWKLHLSAVC